MAFDQHSNFGESTVLVAPAPAASGTSLTLAAGTGPRFPTPPFNCTVWPAGVLAVSTNAEIVRVTALVGDVMTIVRAQESTVAIAIVAGDQIANTTSVKVFTDIETDVTANTAAIATKQPLDATLTELSGLALVQGDVLYQGAATLERLPAGAAGDFLKTQGAGANPVWDSAAAAGALLIANNLSDVNNITTSQQNLNVEPGVDVQVQDQALQDIADAAFVQGDIIYRNATNLVRLPPGTSGDLLQTNGAAANPSWVSPPAGGGIDTNQGLFSARPAAGNTGNLYLATDGALLSRDTGAAWSTFGPMYGLTPLDDSLFAWVNQGTSSIASSNGLVYFLGAAATGNIQLRGRVITAPATPYTITTVIRPHLINASSYDYGLCFRESGTGELSTMAVNSNAVASGDSFVARNWTDPTAISATLAQIGLSIPSIVWLQISDDGVNRIYRYSLDGVNYVQLHSVARTTFLTADQVGFFVFTNVAAAGLNMAKATFLSWVQT